MIHSFGTDGNPAHYVEIDDGVSNPPKRPTAAQITAGLILNVKNHSTGASLPDVTIEANTGYFNFTVEDVPVVDVSADGGLTWIPLQSKESLNNAATDSGSGSTALEVANSTADALTEFIGRLGDPDGIATLDGNGQLSATQAIGLTPQVQHGDGTWDPRPASTKAIIWWMTVAGSSPPAGGGLVTGGAGMVSGFDLLVDISGSLGA